MIDFEHIPHPHIELRRQHGPVTREHAHSQLGAGSAASRFNAWLAIQITRGVATMWCAYLFAGIALITLPNAIRGGMVTLIPWVAQTFIQLVLLSIIMVGQDVLSKAADLRAQQTFLDAEAVLHEAQQIQAHLAEQDKALEALVAKLGKGR